MFLYTLLISTIFADATLRKSRKYIKSKIWEYASPTNVCYSRHIAGAYKAMKLMCEDIECEDDGTECKNERKVVAYKWRNDECDANGDLPYSIDTFHPKDKGNYPFNCFEDEEIENGTVANPNEYTTPYMVVRLRYATVVETVINETTGETEDTCIPRENDRFYRSFAAITDVCHLGWKKVDGKDTPYWYMAHCNLGNDTDGDGEIDIIGGFRVQKFTQYGCKEGTEIIGQDPNDEDISWPVYQANGCRNKKWLDKYWYTEVTECTHPTYNINNGVDRYNYYYSVL